VPRWNIPLPSRRRKKVRVSTVIAAIRCSIKLTVSSPRSPAAALNLDGRLLACSVSFWVMSYLLLSSWNSWLSFAQCSKSET
jgi:hypothetical protein